VFAGLINQAKSAASNLVLKYVARPSHWACEGRRARSPEVRPLWLARTAHRSAPAAPPDTRAIIAL
jgi:hypothetical protein